MNEVLTRQLEELLELWPYGEELVERLPRPDTVDVLMREYPPSLTDPLRARVPGSLLVLFPFSSAVGFFPQIPLGLRAVAQWSQGLWREPWSPREPLPSEPEPLRALLASPDAFVRAAAAAALGQLEDKALGAVEALAACLSDADPQVRLWASWALEAIHPSHPQVTQALDRALEVASVVERPWLLWTRLWLDLSSQQVARWYLEDAPLPLPEGLPRWLEGLAPVLESQESSLRSEAFHLLALVGVAARPFSDVLLHALREEKGEVLHYALRALAAIGPECPESFPEAVRLLDPEVDAETRRRALRVCARFGPQALPLLLKALEDDVLRDEAAEAMGALGPSVAPRVFEALLARLDDSSEVVPRVLAALGPAALPAVGRLVQVVLGEDSRDVRDAAARALRTLGALEAARGAARELVARKRATPPQQPPRPFDWDFVYLLEALGPPALPEVLPLLDTPRGELGRHAIAVIGLLGEREAEVRAEVDARLSALSQSSDEDVRTGALYWLNRVRNPD